MACVAVVAILAPTGPLHPAPRSAPTPPSASAPAPDRIRAAQQLAPRCIEPVSDLRRYLDAALDDLARAHVPGQTATSVTGHVADLAATTRRRVDCAPLFDYWIGIVLSPG